MDLRRNCADAGYYERWKGHGVTLPQRRGARHTRREAHPTCGQPGPGAIETDEGS